MSSAPTRAAPAKKTHSALFSSNNTGETKANFVSRIAFHTLYHACHCTATAWRFVFLDVPSYVMEAVTRCFGFGGIFRKISDFSRIARASRKGIIVICGGDETRGKEKTVANMDKQEASESVLNFFGFQRHRLPLFRRHHFSTEHYTSPLYSGYYQTLYFGTTVRSDPYETVFHEREETVSPYDDNPLFVEWTYCCDVEKIVNRSRDAVASEKPTLVNRSSQAPVPDPRVTRCKGVVALVPGLTSNASSGYLQRYIKQFTASGFHTVLLETRGMGTSPVVAGTGLSAAFVDDVSFLLEEYLSDAYLLKKFGPQNEEDEDSCGEGKNNTPLKLIAVGFSMGGSLVAQHLSKVREKTHLHCGLAIGSPFDLHRANTSITRPMCRLVFRTAFADSLAEMFERVGDNLLSECERRLANRTAYVATASGKKLSFTFENDLILRENLSQIFASRAKGQRGFESVHEFDCKVQCPLHNFKDTSAYYTAGSSLPHLHKCEIPMLCMALSGDPIVGDPISNAQWEAICAANPNILYVRLPSGGHLACVGSPVAEAVGGPNFLEERVTKVLEHAVKMQRAAPIRREVPDRIAGVSLDNARGRGTNALC